MSKKLWRVAQDADTALSLLSYFPWKSALLVVTGLTPMALAASTLPLWLTALVGLAGLVFVSCLVTVGVQLHKQVSVGSKTSLGGVVVPVLVVLVVLGTLLYFGEGADVGISLRSRDEPEAAIRGFVLKGRREASDGCISTIGGDALMDFAEDFDVMVVCGVQDNQTDRFEDTRIAASQPMTIAKRDIDVAVTFYGPLATYVKDTRARAQSQAKQAADAAANGGRYMAMFAVSIPTWREVVLVPKRTNRDEIRKLSDVRRHGGKLLSADVPTRIVS